MERRDIALAIVIGLLLGGAALAINDNAVAWFVDLAYRFWYVGVALVVLGAVIGSRGLSRSAARLLGFAGVLWLAFLVGGQLLYLLGNVIAVPQGG